MRAWLVCLAAALLTACATAPDSQRRAALARQIADDAAAFNEAYAQAVSAQILLNVLRARDRLPRYYLAMTGIADAPSWRYRQNAGVGSIPLGEGASPWGIGSLGMERETQRRPAYAVQPFDEETLTRTAFEATAPEVFAHYWFGGWPRDLLLLVMVERLEIVNESGQRVGYVNEANTIFENCHVGVDTQGCDFVRALRAFLVSTSAQANEIDPSRGRGVCGLVEAYRPTRAVRAAAPADGERCEPVFAVDDTLVQLRLRSLDEMIYYIGELMRAGTMRAGPDDVIEAEVTVAAAGLRGGGVGVPLFRVLPRGAARANIYAAEVVYGGARYVAGPANGRSCGAAAPSGRCADTAEEGDRSSSVLSLIAEILALNQSPDSIRAPSRLIAE